MRKLKLWLIKYIRHVILYISFLSTIIIYVIISKVVPSPDLQKIRLTQVYALVAISFLYSALLVSPLYATFPKLPLKAIYTRARRALGVSAAMFAILHAWNSFWDLLGGINGLRFLSPRYLLAVILGATALTILVIMTITATDWWVRKLRRRWKLIQRFVYAAGFLIIFHALILGSHFADLSTAIPQIFLIALVILLALESLRIDKYITHRVKRIPQYSIATTFTVLMLVFLVINANNLNSLSSAVSTHNVHEVDTNTTGHTAPPADYSVDMLLGKNIEVNEDTKLTFNFYNLINASKVTAFDLTQEEPVHLIIVDSELNYFAHLHPQPEYSSMVVTTRFPHAGIFIAYLSYQPLGATEQFRTFNLYTGDQPFVDANQKVDTNFTKQVDNLEINLVNAQELSADKLTLGNQSIEFKIIDKNSGDEVPNLDRYLGSYGHLVMINESTYDSIHVHPIAIQTSRSPVDFNTYHSKVIAKGIYRLFAEFKYNGKVSTVDFTVELN